MDLLYTPEGEGFLNSNLFLAFVTVFVGFIAWGLYKLRGADEIREAAIVLHSDVNTVVDAVGIILEDFRNNGMLMEGRYLLRTRNWEKYKYTILPAVRFEEWSALNKFFTAVEKYDDAVRINDGFFDDNARQVWVSLHDNYKDRLQELGTPNPIPDPFPAAITLSDDALEEIAYFSKSYIDNMVRAGVTYYPNRPLNMADNALGNIDENILVSTAGTALITLAENRKSLFHALTFRL